MSNEKLISGLSQVIQQSKFTYFLLGKAFEKQAEKQVDALQSLNFSSKKGDLKQIENLLPKN